MTAYLKPDLLSEWGCLVLPFSRAQSVPFLPQRRPPVSCLRNGCPLVWPALNWPAEQPVWISATRKSKRENSSSLRSGFLEGSSVCLSSMVCSIRGNSDLPRRVDVFGCRVPQVVCWSRRNSDGSISSPSLSSNSWLESGMIGARSTATSFKLSRE